MLVAELMRLGLTIDLPYVERNFLGRSYPVVMETIRREFGLDLPPDFEAQYREALADSAEIHVWPGAGHGFNCDQRADYNEGVAKQALERTLSFFQKTLR